MGDVKNGYQATPNATLEQQMMDACAPKNEREWWAFAEIGRLRAEVEALKLQRTAAELVHRVLAKTVLTQAAEIEALKADITTYIGINSEQLAEVEALTQERDALRADAELKRGLLLWALYHAQGGSSPVGQPIRGHLGIEQHAHLTPEQIIDAARAAQGERT